MITLKKSNNLTALKKSEEEEIGKQGESEKESNH